jgi:Mg2+-importing ATPase
VLSASLIVLVIRTRRPFFLSPPAWPLLLTTIAVAIVTVLLPVTSVGAAFAFVPLPLGFYGVLFVLLALYVTAAEVAKRFFYRDAARPGRMGS